MKQALLSFCVFCSLFLVVVACGRLNDKFGRSSSGYTRVSLNTGAGQRISVQGGGMIVYFARLGGGEGGISFAFSNEILASAASLAIPNGSYRVFGLSYAGAASAEGQARCAIGNDGAIVNLVGTSASINLVFKTDSCGFGANGPFGGPNASNSSNNNFDTLSINICSSFPASCTVDSSYSFKVKATLLQGEKLSGDSPPVPKILQPIQTTCVSGSGGIASTSWVIPPGAAGGGAAGVAGGIPPPIKLEFYAAADSSCATPLGTFIFDGLERYYSAATDQNFLLLSPGGSNTTTLQIKRSLLP